MTSITCATSARAPLATSVGLVLLGLSSVAGAQTVEVAPFGGYRFSGDPYYEVDAGPFDTGSAPCVGATLDVFLEPGRSVTFLYSHQEERVDVVPATGPPTRVRVWFDHYQAGATQEFSRGPVRPFLVGLLGLSVFSGGGDPEARFSLGAGGGVKLMPSRHFGLRLDGRAYVVFVSGGTSAGICAPGGCLIGLDVSAVWQAEFTAGAVVAF